MDDVSISKAIWMYTASALTADTSFCQAAGAAAVSVVAEQSQKA